MKPSIYRRIRRCSASHEATNTKKESKQEQSFFGGPATETFFQLSPVIQRKCEKCEEDDKKVQRSEDKKKEDKLQRQPEKKEEEKLMKKEDEKKDESIMKKGGEKEEEKVQKKEAGGNSSSITSSYISSLNGKGTSLPKSVQQFFEGKMGYDFSNVKVHTGKEAAASAREVNAKAYTTGEHIVFNEGQYDTTSAEGKKLMAHELTHVVQQQKNVLRKPEEVKIPELWDKVSGKYSSLMFDLAVVNQKYPAIERERFNSKLFSYSALIGEPGDKSESELLVLDQYFNQIKTEIENVNNKSLKQWGELIKAYDKERKELTQLIDDPISIKAASILSNEFSNTFKKVVNADAFLVYEDVMQLDYMLKNYKHLEQAQKYIERNEFDRGEVDIKEGSSSFLENTGHVSVSVGSTITSEAGLREIYEKGAKEITRDALNAVKSGVPPESAAKWAHRARNDLKALIRSKGSSIVRGFAEARNVRKYGNAIGPAYEELIKKGKTPMDIIGSAGRSNAKVNKGVSKLRVGGRFFIVIDFAIVTWDVFSAPDGQKLKAFIKGAGGIGGAIAGGWAGAKAGGAAGSFFGPIGTGVGGVLGVIGGAIFGGWAGSEVAESAYNLVDELINPPSEWDAYCETVNEIENNNILKK